MRMALPRSAERVLLLYNPRCSKSRAALALLDGGSFCGLRSSGAGKVFELTRPHCMPGERSASRPRTGAAC